MNFKRRTAHSLFLPISVSITLSIGLLAGCGGGSNSSGDGKVRLVNATSEYASFDLYQSTSQLSAGVTTFTAGNYASLGAGTYTFSVQATGSGTTSASSSRTVSKDVSSTLVAYTTGGTLTTQLLTDGEAAPTAGYAKFRVFNTAPAEIGPVDVYLVAAATACNTLSTVSSNATATNVSSISPYSEVTAATAGTDYRVCVTANPKKDDLRLDIPLVRLTNQQITTLILTRSTSGGVLAHGLLMNQQGTLTSARNTAARVRVAAAAAGSAAVTAAVNSVSLSTDRAGSISPYVLVTAGIVSTSVKINGSTVTDPGLSIAAGSDVTLLVAGTAAVPTIKLINDDNTLSTLTNQPVKLRLINALNGVPTAVTLKEDFNVVADSLPFGSASSPPATIAASASLARVEATGAGRTLCLSTGVPFISGKVYTLLLTGDYSATAPTTTPDCVSALTPDR